jgi:hypothetical protein
MLSSSPTPLQGARAAPCVRANDDAATAWPARPRQSRAGRGTGTHQYILARISTRRCPLLLRAVQGRTWRAARRRHGSSTCLRFSAPAAPTLSIGSGCAHSLRLAALRSPTHLSAGKTIQVIAFLSAIMRKRGDARDTGRRHEHVSRLQDGEEWARARRLPPADETWPTCLIVAPSTVVYNWERELETVRALCGRTCARC